MVKIDELKKEDELQFYPDPWKRIPVRLFGRTHIKSTNTTLYAFRTDSGHTICLTTKEINDGRLRRR